MGEKEIKVNGREEEIEGNGKNLPDLEEKEDKYRRMDDVG